VQAAGTNADEHRAGPHSMISRVTSLTVLPTMTGMRISRQNFSSSSDLYSEERWRTVETVPARRRHPRRLPVIRPNSAALGMELTAAVAPLSDLSNPRRDQIFLTGSGYF
jgi:hypothetical protein